MRSQSLPASRSDADIEGSHRRGLASSIAWRRERLLNIGNNSVSPPHPPLDTGSSSSETTALSASTPNLSSYGTIPTSRNRKGRFRRRMPSLPTISTRPNSRATSLPQAPRHQSFFTRSRTKTISLYDPPPSALAGGENDYFGGSNFLDTKLNGIRVWYSSFTSVDWLHDAVKVCKI